MASQEPGSSPRRFLRWCSSHFPTERLTAVGIDPIHFGLVLTLNLAIGQQTPPVASVLMAACAIAKSDIWETTRVNWPYILALLIVLFLCTYVPFLSLVLVHLFYGT